MRYGKRLKFILYFYNVCLLIGFGLWQETLRFRTELLKKLSQEKETFRDDLVTVVDVCAEVIFLSFSFRGSVNNLINLVITYYKKLHITCSIKCASKAMN